MPLELLIFEIDDSVFAVPTSRVVRVLRAAAVFPLPEYPDVVCGGLDLRGDILPVLDGRALFGRPHKAIHPRDHMIVLESGAELFAIHVDRGLELVRVDANKDDSQVAGKFIRQIVNTPRGPTAVADVDQLASVCRPVVAEQAREQA